MLYKRKTSKKWWCRFTAPDGREVRQSTGTEDKRQAQEYEDRLKAELWRIDKLGGKPKYTWQEACIRWVEESGHKRTLDFDIDVIRRTAPLLGQCALDDIDSHKIGDVMREMMRSGMKNASINRLMAVIRAILRKAERDWGWIDHAATIKRMKEPAGRIRWITREEAGRLLDELPDHLEAAARFTLDVGLRASNVTGLKWNDVDLDRRVCWVKPDDSKSGRAIGVPLNNAAVVLLRGLRGNHQEYVFSYKGNPITGQLSTKAFRGALKRAGISDFRWHDLRHTWASWHIQSGTPLHALKELGGWSDYKMVLRYAHLAPEHLAEYAERINPIRTVSGTPENGKEKAA